MEETTMKKILALILCAVMVFAFAGCASYRSYDEIKEDGKLVVATNAAFAPYEFVDDNGEYAGIDIEIAQAVGEYLGLEVVIQDINFDAIITSVNSGKADLGIAGMTVTEERLKSVEFSDTYATGKQVIITASDSGIKGVADLAGKKVGVQTGTTGDIYASDDSSIGEVVQYTTGTEAVLALSQNKVDAVIIDNEPAKKYIEKYDNLIIIDEEYTYEEYAMCFAKGNTELVAKVNEALAALKADGTLKAIIDKYINEK
jgi:polar amino acid transport system substrate-binding protein